MNRPLNIKAPEVTWNEVTATESRNTELAARRASNKIVRDIRAKPAKKTLWQKFLHLVDTY